MSQYLWHGHFQILHQSGVFGLFGMCMLLKCLCHRRLWYFKKKFYQKYFKHDLYCCIWHWYKYSRKIHLNTQCPPRIWKHIYTSVLSRYTSTLYDCTTLVFNNFHSDSQHVPFACYGIWDGFSIKWRWLKRLAVKDVTLGQSPFKNEVLR